MPNREEVIADLTFAQVIQNGNGASFVALKPETVSDAIALLKEQEAMADIEKNNVKQKDIAEIMNRINDVLEEIGYEATGYDNTDLWLQVLIEKA